jgi:exo-beta-1,3-glucanase (GH17 family)
MHYGPWRPGTGPNKGYSYPNPEQIDSDLRLIRELNANTILVFDPPEYVLDLAQKYGLKVLYTFFIEWWSFVSCKDIPSIEETILRRVKEYSRKPAVLAWVLGNEIPSSVVDQYGERPIESRLATLYHSVKVLDTQHPITHSNWPPTKDLDLHFFDLISFNVYPLWPPEVVAMGFGNYTKEVLRPIAAEKPLLVTEFGANTVEAGEKGQARLVRQCWEELQQPGLCGGVVFEFADEWWKNYDNPKRAGNWWDRKSAPDDEKQDDRDPEEHYGVMTAYRQPKVASSVVKDMFATEKQGVVAQARIIPGTIIGLLVTVAFGAWLWTGRGRG